ncbi:MAG: dihydrolipoyl dehydrogenase [Candidatus Meridianibacter frigidus]|nr:MAG: dihydrolipoyl dehydrogenase [Candidatus Eremiobacteraeota bacterium]
MPPSYDLVIVGAGSGGFAAARTARDLGASVAMVDRGPLGGLCILRGCMPSKTLIASGDLAQAIREAGELGVLVDNLSIDFLHIMRRKRELISGFADYRIEGIRQFPIYEGAARFLDEHTLQVGEQTKLTARRFVLATGSVVAPAVVPGLIETGYIDSDGALELAALPESLVVLGGGYIGTELGQFFSRMGVKVTMVVRSSHLLSGQDHDIGHALTEYLRAEGIEVLTETTILRTGKSARCKHVYVARGGAEEQLETQEILFCLGRVPDTTGLDLERAGVRTHPVTGIEVDQTMRTSNPHIFAIGDCTGHFMLVHVAIYEGEIAARNAVCNAAEPADYHLQKTHTVFSDPQVAVAGDTERALQETGVSYVKGVYDFAEHGKAMCLNKTKGFVKILAAPDTGRILGAAVLGADGSDLIHEMIVAMHYKATVFDFLKVPHLHPTMAEIWTYPAEEIAQKLNAVVVEERRAEFGAAG